MFCTFQRSCIEGLRLPRFSRGYNSSKFPHKSPISSHRHSYEHDTFSQKTTRSTRKSTLWKKSSKMIHEDGDISSSLSRLLMANQVLYVNRPLELPNVLLDYEGCKWYSIVNESSDTVGHIIEEQTRFWPHIRRNILPTHRPFRAAVVDAGGAPLLYLHRPFNLITSRMYVQRILDHQFMDTGEPVLETFAEVQQVWHPFRRKYDIFLRDTASHKRILTETSQPPISDNESEYSKTRFLQFAKVDEPPLSWNFQARDESSRPLSTISRGEGGFAHELLTDIGKYHVDFDLPASEEIQFDGISKVARRTTVPSRRLTLDERALILALAVNADFDYFSWHSLVGRKRLNFSLFD